MYTVPAIGQKWQSIHDVKRRIVIAEVKGRFAIIRDDGKGKLAIPRKVSLNDIIDDYTKV